jgi:hypothetical protein
VRSRSASDSPLSITSRSSFVPVIDVMLGAFPAFDLANPSIAEG